MRLQETDTKNEYVVFLQKKNFKDCPSPNRRWKKVVANVPWYSVAEQIKMPRIIDKHRLDLVHYPHLNVPIRAKTPFVVTVHDLIMLDQVWESKATTHGWLKYQIKQYGQRKVLDHIAQKARNIMTVSEHAKNQIIHKFNVSPSRVHVVYNGINRAADSAQKIKTKSSSGSEAGTLAESKKLSGLKKPFLMNAGNPYPHKNIETLLHAFSFFVAEHKDVSLVLVGPDNQFTDRLKKEADEIAIPKDRIHFLGFVSDDELSWLYENANMYVIPSKLEGFGMPPLEALKKGTPVAASRASSIPEVLGPAAIYFDPSDIEDMYRAMETLLTDKNERTRILAAAGDVLKKYTWEKAADQTLDVYNLSV